MRIFITHLSLSHIIWRVLPYLTVVVNGDERGHGVFTQNLKIK